MNDRKKEVTTLYHNIIQVIWTFLLDSDFLQAYQLRMLIKFADGVVRWVFLCIITYAADYLEK